MVLSKRTRHLHDVAASLRRDGVAIFPCDTMLGLVGRLTPEVFRRINVLKQRQPDSPYLVLVPTATWVPRLATAISAEELQFMDMYWPGPNTLLLNRNPDVDPSLFPGSDKIALRWPAYHALNHLLALVKEPLFSTSVNFSGNTPAKRYEDIPWSIEKEVDFVFEADKIPAGSESALVRFRQGQLDILRGALTEMPRGVTY